MSRNIGFRHQHPATRHGSDRACISCIGCVNNALSLYKLVNHVDETDYITLPII